jgi:hypothetical protein
VGGAADVVLGSAALGSTALADAVPVESTGPDPAAGAGSPSPVATISAVVPTVITNTTAAGNTSRRHRPVSRRCLATHQRLSTSMGRCAIRAMIHVWRRWC